MASIYDNIKSARELVQHVMHHGLSTNQEDICRAQDIFGHSTIEELDDLANDIARNDDNGNPDPHGTWSSSRIPTRDTFYQIIFKIWNYEDATRFWNQHTNPEHDELLKAHDKLAKAEDEVFGLKAELNQEQLARIECVKINGELQDQINELAGEIVEKNMTIMELKAKLYDLISNKE